ncbi:MAG: DNA primase [Armatimonadota bacterium]|nr:DNA primase [Armatimonadota bacterium]
MTDAIREQIRSRTDIVELASAHVTLRKRGRRYVGLCPFHSEKTPSFTVDRERGLFYCFGCHAGGDVYDFVMRIQNVSFTEAARELARRAGVAIEAAGDDSRRRSEWETLYRALDGAARFFEGNLAHPETGREARSYLESRGVDGATRERFRLGYAPDAWDHLLRHLVAGGHTAATLERVGLVHPRPGGEGHYDAFRHRLIFPILDLQDRVVAFGGRVLRPDDQPKYLNSRDSPVFHKGRTLYGLGWAREAIRSQGRAVVVEGYMDAISCHQHGVTEAVATLGTALTADQAALLRRFTSLVILVYDSDEAGRRAAERALPLFEDAGVEVRAVLLPDGLDPDAFLRARGRDAFRRALDGALPLFPFALQQAMARHRSDTTEGKVRIIDEVLPLIASVRHDVARSEHIAQLTQRLAVPEEAVRARLRALRRAPAGPERTPDPVRAWAERGNARAVAERHILTLMLEDEQARLRLVGALGEADFSDPIHREIFSRLSGTDTEIHRIRRDLPEPAREVLNRLIFGERPAVLDVEGCIARIRAEQRKERRAALVAAIEEAQRRGDSDRVREIQQELQRLSAAPTESTARTG